VKLFRPAMSDDPIEMVVDTIDMVVPRDVVAVWKNHGWVEEGTHNTFTITLSFKVNFELTDDYLRRLPYPAAKRFKPRWAM
jgi:hypothetical protein